MTNPKDYIQSFEQEVQDILNNICAIAREIIPDVTIKISYGMLGFHLEKYVFYVGAFKNHCSLFPTIILNDELLELTKNYRNPKGNMIFKYSKEIPYDLIRQLLEIRYKQYRGIL